MSIHHMVCTLENILLRILCSHGVIKNQNFILARSPHFYNGSLIPIELVMICWIVL